MTVIKPELRKPTSSEFSPFDQSKVYGKVPPVTVKSILPSEEPKQLGLVTARIGLESGVGEVTVSLIVLVHLLASSTQTT